MQITEQLTRKRQIELLATDLFREKGYAAASMRDLANTIGIEAASLYSHIKSKEEILQRICFRVANKFMENILLANTGSATERLEMAIIGHVKVITDDIAGTAVFWNEWKHLSEPHISEFQAMQQDYEKGFKRIISDGISSREFRNIDNSFMAMTLLSALNGIQKWPTYTLEPEELGNEMAQIFIKGLKN